LILASAPYYISLFHVSSTELVKLFVLYILQSVPSFIMKFTSRLLTLVLLASISRNADAFMAHKLSREGLHRGTTTNLAVAWSENQEDDPNKIPHFPENPIIVNGSKEPYDSNLNVMNQGNEVESENQNDALSDLDKRVLEIMRDVESKFPVQEFNSSENVELNPENYNERQFNSNEMNYGRSERNTSRNPSYDYSTRFDQRVGGFNSNGDSVPVSQTNFQNRQRSSSGSPSYLNDYNTNFDQRIGGFGGNGESLRYTQSKNPPAMNREAGRREVADYNSPLDQRVGQNRPLGSGERIPISRSQNVSSNRNYGDSYNSAYDYNQSLDQRVGQNRPLGSGESIPVNRNQNTSGNRNYNPAYDYSRSFDQRVGQNQPLGSGESIPVNQGQSNPNNRNYGGRYNPAYDYNRSFDQRVGQNKPLGSGEPVPVRQTGSQNRQVSRNSGRRSVIGDYTTSFDQRVGGFLDAGEPEPERPMKQRGPPRNQSYEYDYKTNFDQRIGGLDSNGDPIGPNREDENRWRINT
jgi:hypothetical protein